jgi:isopenicillin-N N-acyltransferase like protein
MDILYLKLSGAPYERGLQHGRVFPKLIRSCHEAYCTFEGTDPKRVRAIVRQTEARLKRDSPASLEEIRGIADGAAMNYEQLLELNLVESIWNQTTGWCSVVCLLRTADGPLVGQTGDQGAGYERFNLLQRVEPDQGFKFLCNTTVGTLWRSTGLNEAGLAWAGSGLKPKAEACGEEGLPLDILRGLPLQYCATVDEALAMVTGFDVQGQGANLLLADAAGKVLIIEKSPGRQAVREPEGGVIFATNHALNPSISELLVRDDQFQANSQARYEKLSRVAPGTPRTVEAMQALLQDHKEPGPICQHGGADLYTVTAYVMAPREQKLWLTQGPPCRNEFREFSL